ncbi:hypothetical protein ACOMHN_020826 [Nucella lapillus]
MNLGSLQSSFFRQDTDAVNVTVTPSLRHTGLTVAPSDDGDVGHGCLVVDRRFDPQDNPENIVSKQAYFWFSTISLAGVIPLLFLVGVPGNILSAAVFYRQGLRERINLCVFCLSLADLVVVSVTFCLAVEKTYRSLVGSINFFIRYFLGLTGFTWVSMFLSAVIAAERCFCVVSPLRAQRMLSTRTLAVVITSISLLLMTGMLTIAGPKHTEACVFNLQTNTTSFIFYVTEYYIENKKILDILDIFVFATALVPLFVITVIITTIITAVKLRSALEWRQKSSTPHTSSESHMVAITRMLVATSVLFVTCTSPILIVQMAIFYVHKLESGGRYHNLRTLLWNVIDLLRCVNSSLNFFVYYRMGSRFRLTLKQLLPCGRKDLEVSRSYVVDSTKTSELTRQSVFSVQTKNVALK